MDTTQHWLILSYASGIDTLACSHHLDDRIPELRKLGIEPVVISSVCSPKTDAYHKIRVPSLAPSGIFYEFRYVARRCWPNAAVRQLIQLPIRLCLLPCYALESLVLNFDCTWSWHYAAAVAAMRAVKKYRPRVIYSTGGSASAHLAAYHCARRTGIPWIAEDQDPIVGEWITRRQFEQCCNQRLERTVATHADAVIFMTRIALEEAEKRTPMGARGHYLYPGTSEQLFANVRPEPKETNNFVLGHFGSLCGSRNTRVLLPCLAKLVEQHPAARQQVKLRLLGNMDRGQKAQLEQFPHQQMLEIHDKRSRAESLSSMLGSDLLLLIQNASSGSPVSIPSKTYEYLHAKVPTLALTYANPELSQMLIALGHLAVDLRDDAGVYTALEQAYLRWQTERIAVTQLQPSPYTTTAAAHQLVEIAESICKSFGD